MKQFVQYVFCTVLNTQSIEIPYCNIITELYIDRLPIFIVNVTCKNQRNNQCIYFNVYFSRDHQVNDTPISLSHLYKISHQYFSQSSFILNIISLISGINLIIAAMPRIVYHYIMSKEYESTARHPVGVFL